MRYTTLGFLASIVFTGCAPPDFTGCAPPDWNGKFEGTLDYCGYCGDSGPFDRSSSNVVILVNNGDTVQLTIGIGSQCTWIADIDYDKAYVGPQNCTLITTEGHFLSQSYDVSGMLTLDGDTLLMNLNSSDIFSGSVNTFCNYTVEGKLERVDE